MEKLIIELKQHTPIIHFQHNQDGATLRASELKPKLDKFLIENAFGGILNFKEYKDYLIGDTKDIEKKLKEIDGNIHVDNKVIFKSEYLLKQKLAFSYKIKIESECHSNKIDLQDVNKDGTPKSRYNNIKKVTEPITKQFPMFFATMGEEWEKNEKRFSFNDKSKINIISFNEKLLDIIKKSLPLFFLVTNFGTRQNKGFGSFYIDENDKNYIPINEVIRKSKFSFWKLSFSIEKEKDVAVVNSYDEYQEFYKVFDKINDFYKAIRSGINLSFLIPPFYLKSLLYVYATINPNITWAKKKIKDYHFSTFVTAHTHIHPGGKATPYLFRDLLGLSSLQEWKNPYNDVISKEDLQKDSNDIPLSDDKIERYKSPITFIPIKHHCDKYNYTVYVCAENNNRKILDRKFEIKSKKTSGLEISTPASFNINSYLDFLTKVDLRTIVDKSMHNHWYFR